MEDNVSAISKYQLDMGDNKVLISSSPEGEIMKKDKYVVELLKVFNYVFLERALFLEDNIGLTPAPLIWMN